MCLAKLKNPKSKEEEIMLTEIIILGEDSPTITERMTRPLAWYLGVYFEDDDVQVREIDVEKKRIILLPKGSVVLAEGGKLVVIIRQKVLKVLL